MKVGQAGFAYVVDALGQLVAHPDISLVLRRAEAPTRFLPVVMITASANQEKVRAIEAGADDFLSKPFEQAELLARVNSLVRLKQYHDTVERQSAELTELNRTLEQRVRAQVAELEQLGRLRRFLSPALARSSPASAWSPNWPASADRSRLRA